MARAPSSGRRLSEEDASLVKGMVARGDRHHDIAAWFGVNQGRVAEVIAGELHPRAPVAPGDILPPTGPYSTGESTYTAISALKESRAALKSALQNIEDALQELNKTPDTDE